jgi:streptogramin lyase
MKFCICAGSILGLELACLLPLAAAGADFKILSTDRAGRLTYTGAYTNGVGTVEFARTLTNGMTNAWCAQQNFFTSNTTGEVVLAANASRGFIRLLAVDISASTPLGYSNLLQSYGNLHTLAGNGAGGTDGVNYWQTRFEGGYATNAALSRPHFAMADNAGNVFIVDKDSHSVLKVTPDGLIHTVAGTHLAGNGNDALTRATNVALSSPNGLWVRGDGTLYVLDTGNSKVRRLDTNGMMATLFAVTNAPISTGRGLWVKDNESLAFFASGTDLKQWTPAAGVKTLNNNFKELGNLVPDAAGDVIATDRGDHKVYLVDATGGNTGGRTRLFGDGSTNSIIEGTLARTNGLYGVRGVWPFPGGGYLLALHEGSQVLYVDAAGIVHLLVDGLAGNFHAGDGQWFHAPGHKICEVRSVSLDSQGNILIVENDYGYVRRIDFTRLTP